MYINYTVEQNCDLNEKKITSGFIETVTSL